MGDSMVPWPGPGKMLPHLDSSAPKPTRSTESSTGGLPYAELGRAGHSDRDRGQRPRIAKRDRRGDLAGQQAREARIGRRAEIAAEFFRRWSEGPMVETRRLVAQFDTREALRDAMMRFIAETRPRHTSCTENSTTSSSSARLRNTAASTSS